MFRFRQWCGVRVLAASVRWLGLDVHDVHDVRLAVKGGAVFVGGMTALGGSQRGSCRGNNGTRRE